MLVSTSEKNSLKIGLMFRRRNRDRLLLEDRMDKIPEKLIYVAMFIVIVCWGGLMWELSRRLNYHFSYKDMVQEQICESVKPEYLTVECGE